MKRRYMKHKITKKDAIKILTQIVSEMKNGNECDYAFKLLGYRAIETVKKLKKAS